MITKTKLNYMTLFATYYIFEIVFLPTVIPFAIFGQFLMKIKFLYYE